jgi:hypothetical protein
MGGASVMIAGSLLLALGGALALYNSAAIVRRNHRE